MTAWPLAAGVVEFPGGHRVRGRGLRSKGSVELAPDVGFSLLGRQPSAMSWPTVWIDWPDFRLPTDRPHALTLLCDAFDRSTDERVEIACGGGKGRTGTALAVLAILSGVPANEAVAWTRSSYHRRAVETSWQRRWIEQLDLERVRHA